MIGAKEIIKQYRPVFDFWLDGGKVWSRHVSDNNWYLIEPEWVPNTKYVQNDRYVKLRKAQHDGYVVQYNRNPSEGQKDDWVTCGDNLSGGGALYNPDTYRIIEPWESDDKPDKLSASEALFGFAGWITTRGTAVTASAYHDSGEWARLVAKFVETQNLEEPREGWDKNLIPFEGE